MTETKNIDEILEDTLGCGSVQWLIQSVILAAFLALAWSMMHMTFAGIIPDWYCVIPELGLFAPDPMANTSIVDTSNISNFKVCQVNGTKCAQFHFVGDVRTTINEWDLVCDLKWIKATFISVQMTGITVGCVASGQISDHFGRRRPYFAFILLHTVCNIIAAFSSSWEMFAVLRFLIGFGIGGMLTISFPYGIEFLPKRFRPIISLVPDWVVGICVFAGVASVLEDWSYLHLTCGLLALPCLLGIFLVPESIRWLTIKGRVEEAVELLNKLTQGETKVSADVRATLEAVAREEKDKPKYTYLHLFTTSWFLVRVSLVFGYFWFAMSVVYYGISFAVSSFAGNFYFNVFLMSILDVPGLIPSYFMANYVGRKWSTMILMGLGMLVSAAYLIMDILDVPDRGSLMSGLAMFVRVAVCCGWCTIQTWGIELYPTVTRNVGFGFQNMCGRIGGIAAPFLINLDESVFLSFSIMVGLLLLLVLLCLTVPETKNLVLPDSMADTELQRHLVKTDDQSQAQKEKECSL